MNQGTLNDEILDEGQNDEEYTLQPQGKEIGESEITELKQEALKMKGYFDEFEKEFLEGNKEFFYVISLKWINLWKKHVSYDHVIKGGEPEAKYFGQLRLPKINSDIVIENPKLAKYPEEDHYCNTQLKPVQAERDYMLITEEAWKYISDKYPGITVKRPCYSLSNGLKRVEVMLKQIDLVPMNNALLRAIDHNKISELKTFVIQVYSQITIKDFKKILEDVCNSAAAKILFEPPSVIYSGTSIYPEAIRFWKLDPQSSVKQFFSYLKDETSKSRSYEYRIPFKGSYLLKNEELKMEEAEIADSDFVFLEARDSGKGWNLTGEGAPAIDKCEYCNKYDTLPIQCGCQKVSYCTEECKFKDKKFHQMRCDKAGEEEEKEESSIVETANSRMGLCGLQNLGNTCFMNGGLQCIMNMKELTEYILANKYEKEINEQNALGTKGKLVRKYAGLVKNVWYGTSPVFSPWAFKHALSQFAQMFSGYQQHDSQEFLAFLVDGIHEDLNRVKVKPFTESIESDGQADYEVARKSWENHLKRNQSVIVDLLHGQYKSTIICPQCERISITFDPFNCVSLPIPTKKEKEIDFFYLHANNKDKPIKMNVRFPTATHTVAMLKEEVAKLLNKNPKHFKFVFSGHTSKEVVDEEEKTLTKVLRKKKKIKNMFAFEIPEEDYNADPEDLLPVDISTTKKATNYFGSVVHKSDTFIRTVYLRKNYNARQAYLKIWKYYRFLFDDATPEEEKEAWNKLSDEESFKKIWDDAEGEKPFYLHLVTNTRGFQDCWFCGDRKCENCLLNCDENIKMSDIISKIKDPEHNFEIEVFFCKLPEDVKLSRLNAYVDFSKEKTGEGETPEKPKGVNVYDCFDLFSVPEQLGEENEWYCNKCKAHQRAKKQMEVYKAPPILMVHLKRFKAGGSFLSKSKITDLIDFPTNGLDIGKYVLNHELPTDYQVEKILPTFDAPQTNPTEGQTMTTEETNTSSGGPADVDALRAEEHKEQAKTPAKTTTGDEKIKGEGLVYDLFGVVNHYGNMGFGHYTAYAKNHKTDKWHGFDDSSVSSEGPASVCTPAAYVLFYRRRDWQFNLY